MSSFDLRLKKSTFASTFYSKTSSTAKGGDASKPPKNKAKKESKNLVLFEDD